MRQSRRGGFGCESEGENRMKQTRTLRQRAAALLCAVLFAAVWTALAGFGVWDAADRAAADALYQSRSARDGEIVLVGIDQKAFDAFGPYSQWGRDVIARTIEALNQSEDCRPAVIGLDILYAGTSDPAADAALVQAAGRYGNVVAASVAEYGTALVETGAGEYALRDFSLLGFEEPFEALRAVTAQGHINAMLDKDGILRHHLIEARLPDGRTVPSLALSAARLYRQSRGEAEPSLPPTDANGFWYLPFCGAPGDFDEAISVADVVSGDVPADYFAGKIVLIGPYAAGLQDSYLTAADHSRPMYGLEYQANAVQALLWQDYKTEVGDGVQLAVLFALLAAAFFGFWRRRVAVSTGVWLLLSGGWLLGCRLLYARGVVLRVLWVPVGVTVLYVGCIAANYIRSVLEKRAVTNTFQRYVAPEIVGELLKEGSQALELGGRLTEIAVLFVDVRGFTSMSEQLAPTQVVEILNRYLTLISDCILKNGGTLDKFVGDAAMAFWGAPLRQEDPVMHAVQAASDMVKGSQALSEELLAAYGRTVSFGIGVHLGEAVVGNIGSPQRMDYTAIGDTVNTAARLEANAPGNTIYISRAVADALDGRIRVTSLGGSVPLKGKKEGFEVLTLDAIV